MERSRGKSVRRAARTMSIVAAVALLVGACGSSKKAATTPTTAASGDNAATTVAPAAGATTVAPAGVSTIAATPAADDKPKRGGKLTYALEAETATGFSPLYSQFAISGEAVARAIYDPVMAIGEDGKTHGVLAETMTANADATQWVIKVRSGIKFHDGTALDANAIKQYVEAGRCSALVATAFGEFGGCPQTFDESKPEDPKTNRKPVSTIFKTITVDPADPMKVTLDLLAPYAVLDYSAAGWWLVSPKQVNDPTGSPKNPVGTGPFKFKEWVVNDHVTLEKNPDYWLKAPDGQPYPYLDEITFKPIDDIAARENCLRGGQCDVMMSSNGDTVAKFRSEKNDWSIFENSVGGETEHYMFNNFPTYKGKENPLADLNVRMGLAQCTNFEELHKLRDANIGPVANGPYPPGTDGYLDDTGYPKFDLAAGKKLIDDYKAAKGITGDMPIDLGETADPFNRGTGELLSTYWKKCGVAANIDQTEQGQYITRGLVGDFQVFHWRNFGGLNPDRNYVWWLSPFSTDPPGIALNFGRIKDKDLDAALTKIRTSTDPAARQAAAKDINKIFAKQVYNLWKNWTVWQFVGAKKVQNVGGSWNAPDGAKVVNTARVSMHSFHSIWIK